MITINIDFKGFIQVDYADLKITKINDVTGNMEPVDVSTITPQEAMEGIKTGLYFVSLNENLANALDGEDETEVSIEEE